jgi:hypothetical protein
VLRSRTVLLLASLTFLIYFANYTFVFWFPTMLKRQSGFSDVNVGMLGAVPCLVLFIAMLVNWISGTCWSTSVNPALTLFVHHGGYGLCLSARLLGDPDRDPRPDGRWKRCRLCRSLLIWIPECPSGIIFVWTGADGDVRPGRSDAYTVSWTSP